MNTEKILWTDVNRLKGEQVKAQYQAEIEKKLQQQRVQNVHIDNEWEWHDFETAMQSMAKQLHLHESSTT